MDVLFSPYELPKKFDAGLLKKTQTVEPAPDWEGVVGWVSPFTLVLRQTQFAAKFVDTWIRYAVAKPVNALAFSETFNHVNDALATTWEPSGSAEDAKVALFPPSSVIALDVAEKNRKELNEPSNLLLVLRRVTRKDEKFESDKRALELLSSLI